MRRFRLALDIRKPELWKTESEDMMIPKTLRSLLLTLGCSLLLVTVAEQPDIPDDYLLPDLQALPPYDVELHGSPEEDSFELWFSVMFWNAGPGALEARGEADPEADSARAYQYFYTRDDLEEAKRGMYVGEFYWDEAHEHVHFEYLGLYEIWTVTDDDALDEVVVTSDKVGFCLIDHSPVDQELIREEVTPRYTECQYEVQGISVGWGDEYASSLPGQQLDISGLGDGNYALVITVNPDGLFAETDRTNNSTIEYFALENGAFVPYPRD